MKPIRYLCLLLIFPICLLFTSCNLLDNNENSSAIKNSEKYGKSVLTQILDAVEEKGKDELVNLFSEEVKNKISDFESIDELFEFYKGTRQSVDYNYSVEINVFESGENYKFDECLAYVKTSENTYRFEFLICKNDASQGIVTLVISTEKSGKSSEYSEYIIKIFNGAEYFNKDYCGVFIFNQE